MVACQFCGTYKRVYKNHLEHHPGKRLDICQTCHTKLHAKQKIHPPKKWIIKTIKRIQKAHPNYNKSKAAKMAINVWSKIPAERQEIILKAAGAIIPGFNLARAVKGAIKK